MSTHQPCGPPERGVNDTHPTIRAIPLDVSELLATSCCQGTGRESCTVGGSEARATARLARTRNLAAVATSRNYGGRMDDAEWYDFNGQLTADEREFLAALRRRTDGRLRPWCRREGPPADEGALIVGLDVDAPEVALITLGVHLDGDRIRGDGLDHQSYTLPGRPTSLALDVTGAPADLAARTADWFDAVLLRPIVRCEWLYSGQVFASRYLFTDTLEGLSQMYNHLLAPPGQREELIAGGYSFGKGWIDTRGLGEPDRVIRIRGGN